MKKPLGEKAIFNRLDKYYKAHWTEEQQEVAAFHTDVDNGPTYTWKFDLEGKTNILTIDKMSGKVAHRII